MSSHEADDLIFRLRKRAAIRRSIPRDDKHGRDRISDLLEEAAAELERHTAALRGLAAERDAERYRNFRRAVSTGNMSKKWQDAFAKWFARYYTEADLDAAIDATKGT